MLVLDVVLWEDITSATGTRIFTLILRVVSVPEAIGMWPRIGCGPFPVQYSIILSLVVATEIVH